MSNKFFLYQGRHGEKILVHADEHGWNYLRKMQDEDNRCTLEDIEGDFGGSYEEGYFWIDDGGHIETIEETILIVAQ